MIAPRSDYLQVILQFKGYGPAITRSLRVVASSLNIDRHGYVRANSIYFRVSNLTTSRVQINLPLNLTESDTMFSAVPWSLKCGCWTLRGSKTRTNTRIT